MGIVHSDGVPKRTIVVLTRTILFCFCCFFSYHSLATGGAERLDRYLATVKGIEAYFTQTLFDEDLNILEHAKGSVLLQRPGQFRWDYQRPYPQSIVSNGKLLWVYDSELSQVTVTNIDDSVENSPSILLTSDAPVESNFQVKEVTGLDGTIWIELTPRSRDSTYVRIRIAFWEDELRDMELLDHFGQITQFRFELVNKNESIRDSEFNFIPPEGVDVVGDG